MRAAPPCLSLIVAVTENGIIGRNGGMPWHLASDLKRFRRLTLGKPVIMGRKTYISIGRPLPGRRNIIISRDRNFSAQGISSLPSFKAALDFAQTQAERDDVHEIFVIGGAEIFKLALPQVQRIYLTKILATIEGDVFFPDFDLDAWHATTSQDIPAGEQDSHPTRFTLYSRDPPEQNRHHARNQSICP